MAVEEKTLETVRKLLDRAEHPNTPEGERDLCIKKADSLMFKHAIDQALLDQHRSGSEIRKPILSKFKAFDQAHRFSHKFGTMMYALQETTRVRVARFSDGNISVVGMPDDVEYFEMVWTGIYLAFVSKLTPQWEDDVLFNQNVYNFKKAGYKWPEIAAKATEALGTNVSVGRMKPAYVRWCQHIGELPENHTQRHGAYRESFAEGFVQTVCMRLRALEREQDETRRSSGAELALVGVQERVDEEFYNLFPHLRPEDAEVLAERFRERRRKEAQEREELLASMTETQRNRFLRKEEEERQKQAKKDDRYWAKTLREQDLLDDSAGRSAGRRAGEAVDLGGRANVGSGVTRGEIS